VTDYQVNTGHASFKKGAATAVSVSTGSKPRRAGDQQLRHSLLGGYFSSRFSLSSGQHFGKEDRLYLLFFWF
jgi:hypothetical protein